MTEEHDEARGSEPQDAPLAEPVREGEDELDAELDEEAFEGQDAGEIDAEALLAEAREDQIRVRASWHLIPKENFAFLFANCLFFAGALCAWSRMVPPAWLEAAGKPRVELDPSTYLIGLDTIRGSIIFALAMYGFFQIVFNIVGRTTKVWPFLLNALLALEVGISGLSRGFGSDAMDMANTWLKQAQKTMLDDITVPLSAIPPAYWLLTLGGMIVLIVILNGIMSGAKQAKQAAQTEGGGRRRR